MNSKWSFSYLAAVIRNLPILRSITITKIKLDKFLKEKKMRASFVIALIAAQAFLAKAQRRIRPADADDFDDTEENNWEAGGDSGLSGGAIYSSGPRYRAYRPTGPSGPRSRPTRPSGPGGLQAPSGPSGPDGPQAPTLGDAPTMPDGPTGPTEPGMAQPSDAPDSPDAPQSPDQPSDPTGPVPTDGVAAPEYVSEEVGDQIPNEE